MIQTRVSVSKRQVSPQPSVEDSPVLNFLVKQQRRKKRIPKKQEYICVQDHKIKPFSHAQYLVKVKVGNKLWSFWTRYSMILNLYQALVQEVNSDLPPFPEKRLFWNLNRNFVVLRQEQLNECLNILFNNKEVRESKTFLQFLSESQKKSHTKAFADSLIEFNLDA